jgi:hypothetical protein
MLILEIIKSLGICRMQLIEIEPYFWELYEDRKIYISMFL